MHECCPSVASPQVSGITRMIAVTNRGGGLCRYERSYALAMGCSEQIKALFRRDSGVLKIDDQCNGRFQIDLFGAGGDFAVMLDRKAYFAGQV